MKKSFLKSGLIVAALGFVCMVACKRKGGTDNNPGSGLDRKPMLTNYADNYIIPGYASMVQELQELQTQTNAFAASPDEAKLNSLRTAWTSAYIKWQKVDMLEFGPAEDVSLRMYMNTYPVTVSKLNGNIASGSYDLEQFGNKDAQGFPALDYLINGIASNSAAIVTFYTTDAQAANRKQYLLNVVNKMLQKVTTVRDGWNTYRNAFVESTGTDAGSSLSKMVNGFILYYERYLRSGKIGLPAGAMTGVAKPEITEAYYSPDLSKTLAVTALVSVKAFYEGKNFQGTSEGQGMRSYMASIGTKDDKGKLMSDVINEELQQAVVSLQGLNTTIRDGVQTNRAAVLASYDEMQQVVPLLKVDMVSAFGISITYTDNDGD